MKIGILTFHCAYNFGAVLQCYALFSTLSELGHTVEVINYRPNYLATKKESFHWYHFINRTPWKLFERVQMVLSAQNSYIKYEQFNKQHLKLSKVCTTSEELCDICEKYDCIVVGSDQVWCEKFNGKDPAWFGVDTTTSLRWVGYAVSAGKTIYDNEKLARLTKRFHAIGAREESLYTLLMQCYKSKASNISKVLDPTLLANPLIWNRWEKPVINEPYILTYQARESNDVFRLAQGIARQLGVRRIIPVDFYHNVRENGFETYVCSPDEFIALIKNASCVVTTSFHGTAFSIILGTPFYTLMLNDGADGRAEDLLESVNLSDRMVNIGSDVTFSRFDSISVYNKLNRMREQSLNFLTKALQ